MKTEIQKRGTTSVVSNREYSEHISKLASTFSMSELVPKQFQKKPADCFIALQMAGRLGVDPMMLMQSMYVVHGRPGFEAKLGLALLNGSGLIKGRIQWVFEGQGKDRSCTAYAVDRESGEKCTSTVDWAMVEGEGWAANKKWKTMPDQMFRYRSAMFLIRAYWPEVLMGMQTVEEIRDIQPLSAKTIPADGLAELKEATAGIIEEKPEPKEPAPEVSQADREGRQDLRMLARQYAGEDEADQNEAILDAAGTTDVDSLSGEALENATSKMAILVGEKEGS